MTKLVRQNDVMQNIRSEKLCNDLTFKDRQDSLVQKLIIIKRRENLFLTNSYRKEKKKIN